MDGLDHMDRVRDRYRSSRAIRTDRATDDRTEEKMRAVKSIILLTPTVAAIAAIWAGYPALGVGMAVGNLIGTMVDAVVRP